MVDRSEDNQEEIPIAATPRDISESSSVLTVETITESETSQQLPNQLPKNNTYIEFRRDAGNYSKAIVLARQLKKGGINKFYVNLNIEGDTKPCCVDWRTVTN